MKPFGAALVCLSEPSAPNFRCPDECVVPRQAFDPVKNAPFGVQCSLTSYELAPIQ